MGDSLVRDQSVHFARRNRNRRRVLCRPGANIDRISAEVKDLRCDNKDLLIVHIGTNDLQARQPSKLFRSEELLSKYKKLIINLKTKTQNTCISGILPRMLDGNKIHSRIVYLNNAVKRMCEEEGIVFLDNDNSQTSVLSPINP
jgi:hypothetical protein